MNKSDIIKLINQNKYKKAIEIGTDLGEFTKVLLDTTSLEKIYTIDKWEQWDEEKRDSEYHYFESNGDQRFKEAKANIEKYKDKVKLIRKSSRRAMSRIKDKDCDVCCIDGDLRVEGLLGDLRQSFNKIKVGGLVFGFYYEDDKETGMKKNTPRRKYRQIAKSNIKTIIDVFAEEYGQDIQVTDDKCWYYIKKDRPLQKEKLDIEIAIHTYHYQHRLCWMLNSILQQKGNVPNILVSISHVKNDGTPTTSEVCDFFREQGLNIKENILEDKNKGNRAIGRNIQTKETQADWILFVDSDMVYDPYFFEDIQKQLKNKLAKETRVIGADRVSLDIPFCIKYFEDDKRNYPCIIDNVADIASQWKVKWVRGKGTAPGNFQLANVNVIKCKGRIYTYREGDIWRATKSDRHFRLNMGGRTGMDVKEQYHLNHDRGGPEIQR